MTGHGVKIGKEIKGFYMIYMLTEWPDAGEMHSLINDPAFSDHVSSMQKHVDGFIYSMHLKAERK
jgi:hypothetical protein